MSGTFITIHGPNVAIDHPHNSLFRESSRPMSIYDLLADSKAINPVNLCITTNHVPKDPNVGFVFGSDSAECDVLLPFGPDDVSGRHFAITFNTSNGAVMMSNLSEKGMLIRRDLENETPSTTEEMITVVYLNLRLTRSWTDRDIYSKNTSFPGQHTQLGSPSGENETFYTLKAVNGEPQPPSLKSYEHDGIMYHFFMLGEKKIAYTDTKVNIAQMIGPVELRRLRNESVKNKINPIMFPVTHSSETTEIHGLFVIRKQAIKIYSALNLISSHLPPLLLPDDDSKKDCHDEGIELLDLLDNNWVAHFPHKRLINIRQLLEAIRVNPNILRWDDFKTMVPRGAKHYLPGRPKNSGAFISYLLAVTVCEALRDLEYENMDMAKCRQIMLVLQPDES